MLKMMLLSRTKRPPKVTSRATTLYDLRKMKGKRRR
jgi:hypothetical protein